LPRTAKIDKNRQELLAKNCQELPRIAKIRQDSPRFAKIRQDSPTIANNQQELSKIDLK